MAVEVIHKAYAVYLAISAPAADVHGGAFDFNVRSLDFDSAALRQRDGRATDYEFQITADFVGCVLSDRFCRISVDLFFIVAAFPS